MYQTNTMDPENNASTAVEQPQTPAASAGLPERTITTVSPKKALGLESDPKKDLSAMTSDLHKRSTANVTVSIDEPKKEEEKKPEAPKVEEKKPEAPKPEAKKPEAPKVEEKKPEQPKPEAPKKIVVDGHEYTEDELKAALKPKPPEPPKQPTPEEIKAQQDDDRKRERQYIEDQFQKNVESNAPWLLTADELNSILDGEEDGLRLFNRKLAEARHEADLSARRWAHEMIESRLEEIRQATNPVIEQYQQVKAYQQEQAFFERHKELAVEGEGAEKRAGLVRKIASALRNHNDPTVRERVSKMSNEEFSDEVARQTKSLLESWGVPLTHVPIPQVKIEEPPTPTPPATPPQAPPAPKPPTANPPSGVAGGKTLDWQTQTARSLRDY